MDAGALDHILAWLRFFSAFYLFFNRVFVSRSETAALTFFDGSPFWIPFLFVILQFKWWFSLSLMPIR